MGWHIVADENLQVTPSLRAIAESLTLLPGRQITRSDLSQADILLVRSVTPVTRELLEGTPVRFVGTATAGHEHIDTVALDDLGVAFSAAPGSNATAVLEYVLTALAQLDALPAVAKGALCGVVGYGEVGRRVATVLAAIGAEVLVWDPLAAVPEAIKAQSLEAVLAAPIVTLHAALHNSEPWPSANMITAAQLTVASSHQIFINAGRGGLITRDALQALVACGATLALDTWPSEPHIDAELLEGCAIATPHIAGYSLDAKSRATDWLVQVWLRLTGSGSESMISEQSVKAQSQQSHTRPFSASAETAGSFSDEQIDWLKTALLSQYDIMADDAALRACGTPDVAGENFDALRKHYPLRRELAGQRLVSDDCQRFESIARVVGVELMASG